MHDKTEVSDEIGANVDDRREGQRRHGRERRKWDLWGNRIIVCGKVAAGLILGFLFLIGELGGEFASMIARILRNTCNGG